MLRRHHLDPPIRRIFRADDAKYPCKVVSVTVGVEYCHDRTFPEMLIGEFQRCGR